MIGGMVETRLAMGTSASFAAGLGGFAFVDLDTPLFLAEDPFEGGYAQDGERLDLRPIARGHGCTPPGA
jgi:L-alanine-DL-glutamate epimerase-like enolase superfamily enzyme